MTYTNIHQVKKQNNHACFTITQKLKNPILNLIVTIFNEIVKLTLIIFQGKGPSIVQFKQNSTIKINVATYMNNILAKEHPNRKGSLYMDERVERVRNLGHRKGQEGCPHHPPLLCQSQRVTRAIGSGVVHYASSFVT